MRLNANKLNFGKPTNNCSNYKTSKLCQEKIYQVLTPLKS